MWKQLKHLCNQVNKYIYFYNFNENKKKTLKEWDTYKMMDINF